MTKVTCFRCRNKVAAKWYDFIIVKYILSSNIHKNKHTLFLIPVMTLCGNGNHAQSKVKEIANKA